MNSASRPNQYITKKQTASVIDAVDFAYRRNMPLTRFISVDLSSYANPPRTFINRFLKPSGEYLAFDGAARAYAWFLENPPGGRLNAHILIHVPRDMTKAFSRNEQTWARMAGLELEPNTMVREKIGGCHSISSGEFLRSYETVVGYCLKGSEQEARDALCLGWEEKKNQGTILGKRVGWSESIGKAARARAGYSHLSSERGALLFPLRYRLDCV